MSIEQDTKRLFYDNGVKQMEVAYVAHGPFTEWYPNAQVKREGTYRYGQLSGACTEYYEDGTKALFGVYVDGQVKNGVLMEWHTNGKRRRSIPYNASGQIHGRVKLWYANGEQSAEYAYENGQRHGESVGWYENGDDKSFATYDQGVKHGECFDYSETTVQVTMYDRGKIKSKMSTVFDDGIEDHWEDVIDFRNGKYII